MLARLLLFLLPFAAFLLWIWVMRQARRRDGTLDREAERRLMLAAGAALIGMVITTAVVVMTREGASEGVYIPPHTVDGQIVPGRFVDPDSPEAIQWKERNDPAKQPEEKPPKREDAGG